MRTHLTYCRLCAGRCGLQVEVEEQTGRIVRIRGDRDHPMTTGYACIKGLEAGELHQGPSRLREALETQCVCEAVLESAKSKTWKSVKV